MCQQMGGVIINMFSLTTSISLFSPHAYFPINKEHRFQNKTLKNSDRVICIRRIPHGCADTPLPGSFNLRSNEAISIKKPPVAFDLEQKKYFNEQRKI